MKKIAYRIKRQIQKIVLLRGEARQLKIANQNPNIQFPDLMKSLKSFSSFSPSQKDSEVFYLFNLVKEKKFKNICEIGSYKGGTFFLLCQAAPDDATLISIDIKYPLERKLAHKLFGKSGQKINCIQGDTKDHNTYKKLESALKGNSLDLLFIDGDHSLFGVMNDFIRYSPLVRKGGIIVFHDICPDSLLRTGVKSESFVGGVPLLWRAIKQNYKRTEEVIENSDQDGYGIGILFKDEKFIDHEKL